MQSQSPCKESRHLRTGDGVRRAERAVGKTGGDAGSGESLNLLERPVGRIDVGKGRDDGSRADLKPIGDEDGEEAEIDSRARHRRAATSGLRG